MTHLPTGIVVSLPGRAVAAQEQDQGAPVLRARLLDLEQREQDAEITADRRAQVGSGERAEKIRTYNFPQDRLTDHRIGLTVHNLPRIMDGELDNLIDALANEEQTKRLQESWSDPARGAPPRRGQPDSRTHRRCGPGGGSPPAAGAGPGPRAALRPPEPTTSRTPTGPAFRDLWPGASAASPPPTSPASASSTASLSRSHRGADSPPGNGTPGGRGARLGAAPPADLRPAAIADIGTGCGAIALALATRLPMARLTATDISPAALDLARRNANALGLTDHIRFVLGDLLSPLEGPADIIVANLPYIPSNEWERLAPEIRCYEPRSALDGGPDGLRIIERLLAQVPAHMGSPGAVILEIGHDQGSPVVTLARLALPSATIAVKKDLRPPSTAPSSSRRRPAHPRVASIVITVLALCALRAWRRHGDGGHGPPGTGLARLGGDGSPGAGSHTGVPAGRRVTFVHALRLAGRDGVQGLCRLRSLPHSTPQRLGTADPLAHDERGHFDTA